ncbi:MAG: sensor histidine kinase, partial [Nitrospira sp.]|nr:sensor histidine kinase [Nitrospira sp.]
IAPGAPGPRVRALLTRPRMPDSVDGRPSAGLGLAIVKRILELHGSAIRVSSEMARGTCFDFSLQRVV